MNAMPAQLIEPPLILPTLHAQATSFALHGYEGNAGYLIEDEAKSAGEQRRLLLSWRAVLSDIADQAGGGQW
jgi:hypothetical protein